MVCPCENECGRSSKDVRGLTSSNVKVGGDDQRRVWTR